MAEHDLRFDHPNPVETVSPAMCRALAEGFLAIESNWTPAQDLKLFEALGHGDGIEVAAKKCGVLPATAVARYRDWRDTVARRDFISQAAQAVVLDVLRAAVGGTVSGFASVRVQ